MLIIRVSDHFLFHQTKCFKKGLHAAHYFFGYKKLFKRALLS